MRRKHYPNVSRVHALHKKILAAITSLGSAGIEVMQIDCTQGDTPVVYVYDCPANHKLHGTACGTGADSSGPFVRKDARVMGCRVTWLEEKRCPQIMR